MWPDVIFIVCLRELKSFSLISTMPKDEYNSYLPCLLSSYYLLLPPCRINKFFICLGLNKAHTLYSYICFNPIKDVNAERQILSYNKNGILEMHHLSCHAIFYQRICKYERYNAWNQCICEIYIVWIIIETLFLVLACKTLVKIFPINKSGS